MPCPIEDGDDCGSLTERLAKLAGEAIPRPARIIAVADTYDAMTSSRSYRKGLPQDVARAEIEKGKGTQFDPEFADLMITLIDNDKDFTMRSHEE